MTSTLLRIGSVLGACAVSAVTAAPAAAATLSFDFKIEQGAVGTTFATLALDELAPGTTTFSLNTALTGSSGNPGITELFFGCNSCGNPTFVPAAPGVAIGPGGTQAGYTFDFRVAFDPAATSGNTPLIWTANAPPSAFLEATPRSGVGPDALAMIQLQGGSEVVNGVNVTSGFYIAAVPEPSTYAMLLAGLSVTGLVLRAKSKRARRNRLEYDRYY